MNTSFDTLLREFPDRLTVLSETRSTNDDLRRLCLDGAPHGAAVLAEKQTGGRGRMGRAFASEKGGVYLSYLVRGERAADPAALTITAAVAVGDAIADATGLKCGIKWVNDLLLDGKKCCGILAEGVYDGNTPLPCGAIVGVGINVANTLPPSLSEIATTLTAAAGHPVAPVKVARALLCRMKEHFAPEAPFPIDVYTARCVTVGHTVTVQKGDETFSAEAVGIAPDGALLLRRDGREETLGWGEIRLVPEKNRQNG